MRPKRNAKARVVKEESEEEEEEEKVPYRRKNRSQASGLSLSVRRRSEEDRPVRQNNLKSTNHASDTKNNKQFFIGLPLT